MGVDKLKRFYRNFMGNNLFSFSIKYKESDLWIALDKKETGLSVLAYNYLVFLRKELEEYATKTFLASLKPIAFDENAPKVAKDMLKASKKANVGPMAAVAGAFAKHIGQYIKKLVNPKKLLVENGGDLYIYSHEPTTIMILSTNTNLYLELPPGEFGIATSSRKIGHSKNFGKTDTTTVVCSDPALADAYATAISNKIKNVHDAKNLLSRKFEEIQDIIVTIDKNIIIKAIHNVRG